MLPIPPTKNTSQDYSAYIINLSTIHGLAPISTVLDNFADLHYKYAQSWLGKWYSKIWVSLKFLTMTTTINEYKLGKINTDAFISKLKDIFYFIPDDVNPEKLLKDTWNSLIVWDEAQSTKRLNSLIGLEKPIYLISNTNELNIQKIKEDFDKATENPWIWELQTQGEWGM